MTNGSSGRDGGMSTELKDHALWMRMVEAAPDGMVLVDACSEDYPLIYVNAAFERITGYRRDEVLGRNCRFLRSGQEPVEVLQEIRRCLQSQVSCCVTLQNARADGELFWNRLTIVPLHNDAREVTHFLGVQQDVSQLMELQQLVQLQDKELHTASRELVKLATRDTLTTVYNRRYFYKSLERACMHCLQEQSTIAVFNVDVDHFKHFNEVFGTRAGDECLQRIAHVLQISFPQPADVVARYGDVEFIASSIGMEAQTALALADTMRRRVSELSLLDPAGKTISVSIGVVFGVPGLHTTPEQLVTLAAHELAKAKLQGGDQVRCGLL